MRWRRSVLLARGRAGMHHTEFSRIKQDHSSLKQCGRINPAGYLRGEYRNKRNWHVKKKLWRRPPR